MAGTLLALSGLGQPIPGVSYAQGIAGVVAIGGSDSVLADARVILLASEREGVVDSTRSGRDGAFLVSAPSAGRYVLAVSLIGYRPQFASVTLEVGKTVNLRIQLSRLAYALDTVLVTGLAAETEGQREFLSRRHLKWSYSYDWTQFKDMHVHTVPDLVGRGLIGGRFPGGCYYVYLDGLLSGNSRARTTTLGQSSIETNTRFGFGENIPLDWVYGVEMYRTYYDIPIRYRSTTADRRCGALLIWTHAVGMGR